MAFVFICICFIAGDHKVFLQIFWRTRVICPIRGEGSPHSECIYGEFALVIPVDSDLNVDEKHCDASVISQHAFSRLRLFFLFLFSHLQAHNGHTPSYTVSVAYLNNSSLGFFFKLWWPNSMQVKPTFEKGFAVMVCTCNWTH